ncbi:MAG TPA: DUF4232 domain-containing protein, partial [Candidatus Limnocylindrales bacterium]|nr:DUF4232 domain-containing protein [Candidatus Limnocylindrales bacterium]
MTTQPDDPIDAAEAQFARRVRDYTQPAVVPVDHARIAATASGGGSRGSRAGGGRFAWLALGAAAVAGVAAVVFLLRTPSNPNVGAATATVPGAAMEGCTASVLEATVGSWEGAAGHRIGTLTLTNTGGAACVLSGTP